MPCACAPCPHNELDRADTSKQARLFAEAWMFLLTEIAVSILVPLVLTMALNWIWPSTPEWRLAFVAGVAMPVALIAPMVTPW